MGTRSTIHFYDDGKNILNIYNQYDGYLSGVGVDIVEFFKTEKGNGFRDLALLYILRNKEGAYHTYATTETDVQEFNYYIYNYYDENDKKMKLAFTVTEDKWINELEEFAIVTLLKNGTLEDLEELVKKEEKLIENNLQ